MRITALDIRNHAFPRTIGGYARDEVDAFLDMVSDDYEALQRENQALRENLIRLEVQVERLSSNEAILQETTTARRANVIAALISIIRAGGAVSDVIGRT